MAKASFQLDPNAQDYTDDEIVGKINTATAKITRAGSVEAIARPIEDEEVTDTKLATGVAKVNLDAMTDTERGYIKTDPQAGEFPITALQRQVDGKLDIDYDDVAK